MHIPHSRPFLGRREHQALRRVITSRQIAQGAEVEAFEQSMAQALGRKHAAAVQSGTAALHLALIVLGVGRNDSVAIPSYVCSSLVHAVNMVGARPLLIDVDRETYNMNPDDLRRRLRPRTKAIILPHMFGLAAEVDDIAVQGVPVIEDCAMSLGAQYQGKPVGSFGTLSVVSFYATKMIATGEGGMVLGNRATLLREVRDLRSYDGHRRHRSRFNYKMTEIQAAMGRAQLTRLSSFIRRRRQLATRYKRALETGPWELPTSEQHHIYYRFVIRAHNRAQRFLSRLNDLGIEARRPVFKPLHRYFELEGFPGTDEAFRKAVSIPLYPALTTAESHHVIEATQRAGAAS